MAEMRIIPDVTHCSPVSRREIYELVGDKIPIVATHIGVQTLNPVLVNLDEGDVKAIAASGGVVGVIFMPYWLKPEHPGPGREAIWGTMKQINDWSGGNGSTSRSAPTSTASPTRPTTATSARELSDSSADARGQRPGPSRGRGGAGD